MFYCHNKYDTDDMPHMTVEDVIKFLEEHPNHKVALDCPHALRTNPYEMALVLTRGYILAHELRAKLESSGLLTTYYGKSIPYNAEHCLVHVTRDEYSTEGYALVGMVARGEEILLQVEL